MGTGALSGIGQGTVSAIPGLASDLEVFTISQGRQGQLGKCNKLSLRSLFAFWNLHLPDCTASGAKRNLCNNKSATAEGDLPHRREAIGAAVGGFCFSPDIATGALAAPPFTGSICDGNRHRRVSRRGGSVLGAGYLVVTRASACFDVRNVDADSWRAYLYVQEGCVELQVRNRPLS